jgi:hypothetical protein
MGEGLILTKEEYIKLVNADIKALNKHMPEHSLEKRHILMVLQWSIENYPYGEKVSLPKEIKFSCSDLLPDGFVFSESGRVILDPTKYPKED